MRNSTTHSITDKEIVNVCSLVLLFSLFSYSEIESLNGAIAAIKNNSDDEELAGCLGLDTSVVSTLKDTLSRSARMQLEINMSHNYLIFHNNPHELSVNEVSEVVTKKCKGLVDNLISKEVFERLQLEAVLRFASEADQTRVLKSCQ